MLFALCSPTCFSWCFKTDVCILFCLKLTQTHCSNISNNKELNFAYYLLEIISYFFACKFWNARNEFKSWKTFVNMGKSVVVQLLAVKAFRTHELCIELRRMSCLPKIDAVAVILCWMRKILNWIELNWTVHLEDKLFGQMKTPKCLLYAMM